MLTANRREHLAGLGAIFGTALAAPLAQALAAVTVTGGFFPSHPFFTPDQRLLVAAVSERIIPTTDTPGAVAAGVPDFIEMMLADWYEPASRNEFITGFSTLQAHARSHFGKAFAELDAPQQDTILTEAMQAKIPDLAARFFEHCRQLVILGYYSSEIGCKVERVYVPVPGRYDGAYPYAEVRRVFSS